MKNRNGLQTMEQTVVQVRFPCMSKMLDYVNDGFDLRPGDLVYVDGKLAGIRGTVVETGCEFRFESAAYRKITAVVDTRINGRLYVADDHFVAFDPGVLPYGQMLRWFRGPEEDEAGQYHGQPLSFPLEDLEQMQAGDTITRRGQDYFLDGCVQYLCVEGGRGRAIVAGTDYYEVAFTYRDGQISTLTCGCRCSYPCKHEVAAMLQLRQLLAWIRRRCPEQFRESGYFAAVRKPVLFRNAIERGEAGSIDLMCS